MRKRKFEDVWQAQQYLLTTPSHGRNYFEISYFALPVKYELSSHEQIEKENAIDFLLSIPISQLEEMYEALRAFYRVPNHLEVRNIESILLKRIEGNISRKNLIYKSPNEDHVAHNDFPIEVSSKGEDVKTTFYLLKKKVPNKKKYAHTHKIISLSNFDGEVFDLLINKGKETKSELRKKLAKMFNLEPEEIIFRKGKKNEEN